ncbi:hypothetical protein PTKIN_Ptkin06aG0176100 [Pterospermum kingtungense]
MGCFFACFSVSKNKKRHHFLDGTSSNHQVREANEAVQSSKEEDFRVPFNSITVKKEKLGELLNYSSGKKKVNFDLNVKSTHEELPVESSDKLLENNEDEESTEEAKETAEKTRSCVSHLTASNVVCKSQNNRYKNCAENGDELEDLDLEVSDLDNENSKAANEPQLVMEESSESLFSLSIESRKQVFEVESGEREVTSPMPIKSPAEELKPIGLNRNAKDRGGQCVQSVLNPVENLAQWKAVKAKASIPLKAQEKENINVEQEFDIPISPEPSFRFATFSSKPCCNDKKPVGQEAGVDTSLSSWLVEPENTPNSKASSTNSVGNSASKKMNSPRSHEDRPILGALTVEELKQHSASTTPRKCRSRSPDEMPIVGTVGSYWSHTGQIIDSDSSSATKGTPRTRSRNIQEGRPKWNPIPFEAELEKALVEGIAGV